MDHNGRDIATYAEQKLKLAIASQEPQWGLLRDRILRKSAGVFLWVVLVVDELLRLRDDGNSLHSLLRQLHVLSNALETLFSSDGYQQAGLPPNRCLWPSPGAALYHASRLEVVPRCWTTTLRFFHMRLSALRTSIAQNCQNQWSSRRTSNLLYDNEIISAVSAVGGSYSPAH